MAAGETETGRGSHDGDEEMRTWKGGGFRGVGGKDRDRGGGGKDGRLKAGGRRRNGR